jgi:acyl-CoA thioesterase I
VTRCEGPRVLFFGDSLVAGVGDPTALGWVGRIAAASFAAGTSLTAYNLGVRRETSVQVAARWRAEALPRLVESTDCRVVLSFGANDATAEDGRARVTADRSTVALTTILREIADLRLASFVIGPAPVDDAEHNERLRQLSDAFSAACRQLSVPFAAVFDPPPQVAGLEGRGRYGRRRSSRSRRLPAPRGPHCRARAPSVAEVGLSRVVPV